MPPPSLCPNAENALANPPDYSFRARHLVEESYDLARGMLPSGLLVVHNASRRGEHHVAELTRWEQLDHPLFEVCQADVVAGGDDAGLVEARRVVSTSSPCNIQRRNLPAVELDNNLSGAVVVNLLELSNVAC